MIPKVNFQTSQAHNLLLYDVIRGKGYIPTVPLYFATDMNRQCLDWR